MAICPPSGLPVKVTEALDNEDVLALYNALKKATRCFSRLYSGVRLCKAFPALGVRLGLVFLIIKTAAFWGRYGYHSVHSSPCVPAAHVNNMDSRLLGRPDIVAFTPKAKSEQLVG